MSDNQSPNASLLNSIIGEGTRINGEFDLSGLLRIDGDFTGTIRTNGQIIVGLNGRAACNIYADSVVIGGVVRGNIFTTDKVIILSTGMMIGNIRTPRLIVEEGVVFNGNCKTTASHTSTVETDSFRISAGYTSAGHISPTKPHIVPGPEEKDHPTTQLQKVTGDESIPDNDRQDSVTSRN